MKNSVSNLQHYLKRQVCLTIKTTISGLALKIQILYKSKIISERYYFN